MRRSPNAARGGFRRDDATAGRGGARSRASPGRPRRNPLGRASSLTSTSPRLDPRRGHRSSERGFVLATTNIRGHPTEVEPGPEDRMPRHCVLNTDHVTSLAKSTYASRSRRSAPTSSASSAAPWSRQTAAESVTDRSRDGHRACPGQKSEFRRPVGADSPILQFSNGGSHHPVGLPTAAGTNRRIWRDPFQRTPDGATSILACRLTQL